MRFCAQLHPVVAFSLMGALAVSSLLDCGSSGSGGTPADASINQDGAAQDATNANDSESGAPLTDAGGIGDGDATSQGDVAIVDGAIVDVADDGDAGTNDAADGSDAPTGSEASAPTSVTFSIDVSKGPTRQFQPPALPAPVSAYVYGINGLGTFVQQKTRWGLIRKGGNTYSDWNWTINYLNAGSTECFWQGQAGGGSSLAGAITTDSDTIGAAQAAGAAYLATVPIGEHVAAAFDNDTRVNNACPLTASDCYGGMTPSTGVNSDNLSFVSVDGGSAAFVANAASKPGSFCSCPPAQVCDAGCSVSTNPVYQDEFVNYIKSNYGSGGSPTFFELDNEPNYWGGVHPELWPFTGALPCQASSVTYDDILSRDKQFAAAIKKVWPSTKVFGPVVSQDGLIYAHSYDKDPHFPIEFLDYYLTQMAQASATAGTALLDVVDLHYYNFRGAIASQCVQNPRMFWDPNYLAASAATTDSIDFAWAGLGSYFDTTWYPRRMIPRLLEKIVTAYPSGGPQAPGLSFSEYNSGCETEIAGAVTEADDLGVFGREGVFAATAMPVQALANNYLVAAFDLYRNYDGNGAVVGDTSVTATTSDLSDTSVYAFTHSNDPSAVEVVAINKTSSAVPTSLSIASAPQLSTATLYDIVNGSAAVVPVGGVPPVVSCVSGTCGLAYTMPAMSATTIVLR